MKKYWFPILMTFVMISNIFMLISISSEKYERPPYGILLVDSQDGHINIFSETMDITADSTSISIPIEVNNTWLIMFYIKAHDDDLDWEISKASYEFSVIPPEGLDVEFDPDSTGSGEMQEGNTISAYLQDIPYYESRYAEDKEEVWEFAYNRFNNTNGSGIWTLQIDWTEPSLFGMAFGGSVDISITIWQYEVFVGPEEIYKLVGGVSMKVP
jgi:hypothetical protein